MKTTTKTHPSTVDTITVELTAQEAARLFAVLGSIYPTETLKALHDGGYTPKQAKDALAGADAVYEALCEAFGPDVHNSNDTAHLI